MTADELGAVVEARHGGKATLFYVAKVINTFGQPQWDGKVHVFHLDGHPETAMAYAWCFDDAANPRAIQTVLDGAGIRGAYDAVQFTIAGEGQK